MKRLHGIGYEGWIVVEAEQDPKTANPLIYAKKGYQALVNSLNKAGYKVEV